MLKYQWNYQKMSFGINLLNLLNNWLFGAGINEIIDGFYINADGTKGKYLLDE